MNSTDELTKAYHTTIQATYLYKNLTDGHEALVSSKHIMLSSLPVIHDQARHDLLHGLTVANPPLARGVIYKVFYCSARNYS